MSDAFISAKEDSNPISSWIFEKDTSWLGRKNLALITSPSLREHKAKISPFFLALFIKRYYTDNGVFVNNYLCDDPATYRFDFPSLHSEQMAPIVGIMFEETSRKDYWITTVEKVIDTSSADPKFHVIKVTRYSGAKRKKAMIESKMAASDNLWYKLELQVLVGNLMVKLTEIPLPVDGEIPAGKLKKVDVYRSEDALSVGRVGLFAAEGIGRFANVELGPLNFTKLGLGYDSSEVNTLARSGSDDIADPWCPDKSLCGKSNRAFKFTKNQTPF